MPYVPPHLRAQPGHHGRDVYAPPKSLSDLASGPIQLTGKKPPNRSVPGPHDKWEKGQELRRGRSSAPKNFGVMAGRRTLAPGEDLPGGTRIDPEGMVYALEDSSDGAYFCDRFRRYRFETRASGLALLRGLVVRLSAMLEITAERFSEDEAEAEAQRAQGYALYEEKPTLRKGNVKRVAADGETHTVGTWSDEEYSLVGFQWMYIRLKSFQRFTESWALLERCAVAGLLGRVPGVVGGVMGPPAGADAAGGKTSDDRATAVAADLAAKATEAEKVAKAAALKAAEANVAAASSTRNIGDADLGSVAPFEAAQAALSAGSGSNWADEEDEDEEVQRAARTAAAAAAATAAAAADAKRAADDAAVIAARPNYRLRIVSLGGGPGFELLAAQWFLRYWSSVGGKSLADRDEWLQQGHFEASELAAHAKQAADEAAKRAAAAGAPRELAAEAQEAQDDAEEAMARAAEVEAQAAANRPPQMEFASLDLQASWDAYVLSLGKAFSFCQWDVHGSGPEPVLRHTSQTKRHPLDTTDEDSDIPTTTVCMLSNILCYCSDEATADLFTAMLSPGGGVSAFLVNERNAQQSIVGKLQRRGVVVFKLLDQQTAGRDDRQMVFLPPGSPLTPADAAAACPPRAQNPVFPNQPYEERKERFPNPPGASGECGPRPNTGADSTANERWGKGHQGNRREGGGRVGTAKIAASPPVPVINPFLALGLSDGEEEDAD